MRRTREIVGLIIGTVVFALAGLQSGVAAEPTPKEGGSVIMATGAQVQGFDALTMRAANRETTMAGGLIFSNFFTRNDKGDRVPDLATAFDSSPDGLTWRLTLRPGLKFSNGAPYTAQDVAHHFQRILDPSKNQAFAAALGSLKEAVAIDDLTVEFRLAYAWAAFPSIFAVDNFLAWVMPKEHQEAAGPDLNRRPIGAGHYVMTEWKQDDSITFEKNPYYWNPKAQHLDKIVIRFLPDATARFTAVRTGDIDIFYEPLGKQVIEARDDKTLKVLQYIATGAHTVNINTASPPLDDIRVRLALAYALDRNVELKVAFAGLGEPAKSFWGTNSEWNCPDVGYPEYDPEKARALLAEYGKPVKIVLQAQPVPTMAVSAQLYQSFWQKVGIETEIRTIQGGPSYIQPVLRGDYQLAMWEVVDVPDPDFQVYQAFFSKSGGNLTKINDPILDEAIQAGRRNVDVEVRKKAYCDFSKEMAKQMPILLRNQSNYLAITHPRVHNIPPMRRGLLRLNEAWVDPK
jgi:ABC-type transport system substrate-binding protein